MKGSDDVVSLSYKTSGESFRNKSIFQNNLRKNHPNGLYEIWMNGSIRGPCVNPSGQGRIQIRNVCGSILKGDVGQWVDLAANHLTAHGIVEG